MMLKNKLTNWVHTTRYMQYLAAITATISMAAGQVYLSWPSPTLLKLKSGDSPIGRPVSDEEGSWIVSSFLVGALVGYVIAAWMVERYGRRWSLLLSAVPMFVPWIVIIFAKNVILICVARIVGGIGSAIATTACSVYNAEIAEKDIRGRLGITLITLKIIGLLFLMSVGPFVSYTALALGCSAFPVVFAVTFYFMPESPYYIMKRGRPEKARLSLTKLSAKNAEKDLIDKRLQDIQENVEFETQNKSTLWELITKREYRKALIIVIGLQTILQLSGLSAIEAYMQTIIVYATSSSISPEISSIIFGFVQLPAALFAATLVDRLGRKPLLILSSFGCAVALCGEGTYFYLQDVAKTNVNYVSWLPTTGIVLYLFMIPISQGILDVLLGELFTMNIKGLAVSIAIFYGTLVSFFVTKFFELFANKWGKHVEFWMFGSVFIVGSAFIYFYMPETKGKTFPEIQAKLNRTTDKADEENNVATYTTNNTHL